MSYSRGYLGLHLRFWDVHGSFRTPPKLTLSSHLRFGVSGEALGLNCKITSTSAVSTAGWQSVANVGRRAQQANPSIHPNTWGNSK